jgi:hypothetical protein
MFHCARTSLFTMEQPASGNFNKEFRSRSESENTMQNVRQLNRLENEGKVALNTEL